MMAMSPSDIAILNIKGSDYDCGTSLIGKNEATNLFKRLIWLKKSEHHKT